MLIQSDVRSYEKLYHDFSWNISPFVNISELVCDRHARTRPLAIAVIEDSEQGVKQFTFADLKRLSDNLAGALNDLGIKRGDRVVVMLGQEVEALISHHHSVIQNIN